MKTNLKYREEQKLTFKDADDNFRALMYWSGAWQAGSYERNEMVWHKGILFIALVDTNVEPSLVVQTDWQPMTPVVGRGQLRLDTPAAGADITAAWQPLAAFDAEPITSMGVDLVPATGTFTFQWRGLWRADMYFSMTHDESNNSREIGVRRYNVTTGTPDVQTIIGIGRNQDATVFSFSDLLEVNEYDTWRYEIGGIDTVSSVMWNNKTIGFQQAGV